MPSCVLSFVDYDGFFCFKQKTAYDMRSSDWSSDVCSSDLLDCLAFGGRFAHGDGGGGGARPDDDVDLVFRDKPLHILLCLGEIGRASCRESGCQYVSFPVVAVSLHNKQIQIDLRRCMTLRLTSYPNSKNLSPHHRTA